jgi:hypothetical protein
MIPPTIANIVLRLSAYGLDKTYLSLRLLVRGLPRRFFRRGAS